MCPIIVGIGASAGGLAAFEAFFSGIPANIATGMAFVLVQRLAPDHESMLTDLIKRCTRMEVQEVTDGMVVKPDCKTTADRDPDPERSADAHADGQRPAVAAGNDTGATA